MKRALVERLRRGHNLVSALLAEVRSRQQQTCLFVNIISHDMIIRSAVMNNAGLWLVLMGLVIVGTGMHLKF